MSTCKCRPHRSRCGQEDCPYRVVEPPVLTPKDEQMMADLRDSIDRSKRPAAYEGEPMIEGL